MAVSYRYLVSVTEGDGPLVRLALVEDFCFSRAVRGEDDVTTASELFDGALFAACKVEAGPRRHATTTTSEDVALLDVLGRGYLLVREERGPGAFLRLLRGVLRHQLLGAGDDGGREA